MNSRKGAAHAGAKTRATAARAIDLVLVRGRNIQDALAQSGIAKLVVRDQPLVRALVYGTLRTHRSNRFILRQLLRRPLRNKDRVIEALLSSALFQFTSTGQPDYAIVSASVEATSLLERPHLSGMVNAVLRGYLRDAESLREQTQADDEARWNQPQWLIDELRTSWPQQWQQVLEGLGRKAPMWLRVNSQHGTREDYVNRLQKELDQTVTAAPEFPYAICLAEAVAVDQLPGFSAGDVSVQDAASQIAAQLIGPTAGMRVLDACAAPGGKTTHMLELAPEAEVFAVDESAERLKRLQENLLRLKLECTVVEGDALQPDTWWDKKKFDQILLDAPCSATGVIRRHPDISFLRKADDIPELVRRQKQILNAIWPLLKEGGHLVYSTCSILPVENQQVVAEFLAEHQDARELRLTEEPLVRLAQDIPGPGYQLLPGEENTDGFYYALMERPLTR
ncbi:MAG: 16S rRNA (cytosine(967)-C(5))-methyltransferase RsmB [Gammaproteobacteria bacterium]